MRNLYIIAGVAVLGLCIAFINHGLDGSQEACPADVAPPIDNAVHEAYRARREAQEAARRAAVTRRAMYRRQRFRGW